MTELTEIDATHPPPASFPADKVYAGIAATLSLPSNSFWWSSLQAGVVQFVTQCDSCLLLPLLTSHRPWTHITV